MLLQLYYIILILVFFILINCLFYFYKKKVVNEFFKNNIIFLNKEQLYKILILNEDKYYEHFYNLDYKARKIKSIDEYIIYIKKAVCDGDKECKEKISRCIMKADNFFENIHFSYFNGKKNNSIPWKIGFVQTKLYENGLPHTRNDTIILHVDKIKYSSMHNLIKTLIHEKVHIYQKKYPEQIQNYLDNKKFKRVKERGPYDNIRANPDLDNYIYQDENHLSYKALYNKNPSSIEDIIYYPQNNQSYEHPYEKMAIDIENLYKSK